MDSRLTRHTRFFAAPFPSPPPQTDLNGDGKPEVLTATPDGLLRLLAPRKFGDGFAQAEVRVLLLGTG